MMTPDMWKTAIALENVHVENFIKSEKETSSKEKTSSKKINK